MKKIIINQTKCNQIPYIRYSTMVFISNNFKENNELLSFEEFNRIMIIIDKIMKDGIWKDYDHYVFNLKIIFKNELYNTNAHKHYEVIIHKL